MPETDAPRDPLIESLLAAAERQRVGYVPSASELEGYARGELPPEERAKVALYLLVDRQAAEQVADMIATRSAVETRATWWGFTFVQRRKIVAVAAAVLVAATLFVALRNWERSPLDLDELRRDYDTLASLGAAGNAILPYKKTLLGERGKPTLTFVWRKSSEAPSYILVRPVAAPGGLATRPVKLRGEEGYRPAVSFDEEDANVRAAQAVPGGILVAWDFGLGSQNPTETGHYQELGVWPVEQAPPARRASVDVSDVARLLNGAAGWTFAWAIFEVGTSREEIDRHSAWREFEVLAEDDAATNLPPQPDKVVLRLLQEERFGEALGYLQGPAFRSAKDAERLFYIAKWFLKVQDTLGFKAILGTLERLAKN